MTSVILRTSSVLNRSFFLRYISSVHLYCAAVSLVLSSIGSLSGPKGMKILSDRKRKRVNEIGKMTHKQL